MEEATPLFIVLLYFHGQHVHNQTHPHIQFVSDLHLHDLNGLSYCTNAMWLFMQNLGSWYLSANSRLHFKIVVYPVLFILL